MEKKKAAVLGATGLVGQAFVRLLAGHPWFETAILAASGRRTGSRYGDEVRWMLPLPLPPEAADLAIAAADPDLLAEAGVEYVFSALPADIAATVEPALRDRGMRVFTNAAAMRSAPDVPVIVPDVNLGDIASIERQGYPGGGFIVANPNCAAAGLVTALAPLRFFGISEIYVATCQSISGAGYPGLPAMDIAGDLVPFIPGEEEKIARETRLILGIDAPIRPVCVRVPVRFGHLETVWVRFDRPVRRGEILDAWAGAGVAGTDLPTMPARAIEWCDREDLPRPSMSFCGEPPGMTVYTGRLRAEEEHASFVLLSNNLVKGAAGGSVSNAEAFMRCYGEI